jgi:hypothetical protein
MHRNSDLAQIVGALNPSGCFADLLHSREEQADKDCDNRDDYEQFDQSEGAAASGGKAGREGIGETFHGMNRFVLMDYGALEYARV